MLTSTHKKTDRERFKLDAEHPKVHGSRSCLLSHCRRHCLKILGLMAVVVAALVVRLIYASTFIVDDILEIKEIRQLYTSEKITIRTIAPADIKDLKAFVEHYTICPHVHEIRVIWWQAKESPPDSVFTYTKAHSYVAFDRIDGTFSCDQKEYVTPSIVLLDADVFVECSDIKYLGEVFQSTSNALVGYYPRLHKKLDDNEFEFLGWGSVLWNRAYSVLLTSAVMVDTKLYNSICDQSDVSVRVQEVLKSHPQCFDVFLSIWTTYKGANPPVWVPTAPSIRRIGSVATPWSVISSRERSKCLSHFAKITGVKDMHSAAHKAADARKELFW